MRLITGAIRQSWSRRARNKDCCSLKFTLTPQSCGQDDAVSQKTAQTPAKDSFGAVAFCRKTAVRTLSYRTATADQSNSDGGSGLKSDLDFFPN